jgi:hypothetical protein
LALLTSATLGACGGDQAVGGSDDAGDTPEAGGDDDAGDASPTTEAGAGVCFNLPVTTVVRHDAPALAVTGDPGSPLGIYDPSLAEAPAGDVALAYSSTAANDVHTRIAVTHDHGATFAFASEPNVAQAITVTNPDGRVCGKTTCDGVFWHEVPSLAYDPTDPDPSRAYKLFVHTYVSLKGGADLRREWGYIGEQTAPAPSGPWSAETKLLGWVSDATISTDGIVENLTALNELADCVAFTEPGAVVSPLGLDLALTCLSNDGDRLGMRVLLLRSKDHGQTFSLVTTLFDSNDSRCLGSPLSMVNGANPFFRGGDEYVAATPIGTKAPSGSDYLGCVVVPIARIDTGALAREANGAPRVVRILTPDDGRFAGPCAYSDDTGYLFGMFSAAESPAFRIVGTKIAAP